MRMDAVIVLVAIGLTLPVAASAGGEIYGTVHTTDGREITGPIRWDKNENFWDDFLDAGKMDYHSDEDEGYSVRLLWWKVAEIDGDRHITQSQFSIPFGHLTALEVLSGNTVELTLKTGDAYTVRAISGDLGPHMRGVEVEDGEGTTRLVLPLIRRVEFAPGERDSRDGERLHGTMETSGGSFTGFIVWDRDESLLEDVLDGEEDGRDREVPFAEIASIERKSRRASLVTLRSGSTMELRGTNDVDSDNRGIDVFVEGLGRISASWEVFEKVTFSPAPPSPPYDSFDGGRRLVGRVDTRDGRRVEGEIVWDRDEEFTWETLDGESEGLDYAILFEHIHSILPSSDSSARVRLNDGELVVLEKGNDVSQSNKGIVVRLPDGNEEELAWHEVRLVTFSTP